MDPVIQKLQEKKEKLHAQVVALLAAVAASVTPEQEAEVSRLKAEFDAAEQEIERRTKMLATADELGAKVVAPQRKTSAEWLPSARVEGGDTNGATKGSFGFRNVGEFAQKVCAKAKNPHASLDQIDNRLAKLYAATLSTYGSEGVGADGGYAVPPDFRANILKKIDGEDSLLGLTSRIDTASNSVTLPIDEVTPWDTTTGVQAYWEGEAQALPQSKPGIQNTTIRTQKLTALVGVTDELLSDAPALNSWLQGKAPDKINYKVNDAIVNGTGAGMPTGMLQAGGLITVAAEGGQTAGTINYANITKMWSRMRESQRRGAYWVCNQDAEPQLMAMVVTGGSPALPAYLPANGLSDSPYAKLMGRPLIYTEATKAIGTPGDIMLCDFNTYLTVVKGGGIREDISIHLWFDQDTTAFRWILRIGGQGLWKTTVTRPGAKQPYGSFVALAAR